MHVNQILPSFLDYAMLYLSTTCKKLTKNSVIFPQISWKHIYSVVKSMNHTIHEKNFYRNIHCIKSTGKNMLMCVPLFKKNSMTQQ